MVSDFAEQRASVRLSASIRWGVERSKGNRPHFEAQAESIRDGHGRPESFGAGQEAERHMRHPRSGHIQPAWTITADSGLPQGVMHPSMKCKKPRIYDRIQEEYRLLADEDPDAIERDRHALQPARNVGQSISGAFQILWQDRCKGKVRPTSVLRHQTRPFKLLPQAAYPGV